MTDEAHRNRWVRSWAGRAAAGDLRDDNPQARAAAWADHAYRTLQVVPGRQGGTWVAFTLPGMSGDEDARLAVPRTILHHVEDNSFPDRLAAAALPTSPRTRWSAKELVALQQGLFAGAGKPVPPVITSAWSHHHQIKQALDTAINSAYQSPPERVDAPTLLNLLTKGDLYRLLGSACEPVEILGEPSQPGRGRAVISVGGTVVVTRRLADPQAWVADQHASPLLWAVQCAVVSACNQHHPSSVGARNDIVLRAVAATGTRSAPQPSTRSVELFLTAAGDADIAWDWLTTWVRSRRGELLAEHDEYVTAFQQALTQGPSPATTQIILPLADIDGRIVRVLAADHTRT